MNTKKTLKNIVLYALNMFFFATDRYFLICNIRHNEQNAIQFVRIIYTDNPHKLSKQ